jgi:hypothetical protein
MIIEGAIIDEVVKAINNHGMGLGADLMRDGRILVSVEEGRWPRSKSFQLVLKVDQS